jgi:hypothetical protein
MGRIGRSLALAGLVALGMVQSAVAAEGPPKFQVDAMWPKPLPNKWILGQIGGIYVDSRDHVWINQRPGTLNDRAKRAVTQPDRYRCCVPAPSVIEFDPEGNVVQAWGGPGQGYQWQANEHGIFVDHNNFVWVGGNGEPDGQILKFTRDGKFVMQIGKSGPQRHHAARPSGRHDRRSPDQRIVRGGRLFQPPHCRVRCRDRRL